MIKTEMKHQNAAGLEQLLVSDSPGDIPQADLETTMTEKFNVQILELKDALVTLNVGKMFTSLEEGFKFVNSASLSRYLS